MSQRRLTALIIGFLIIAGSLGEVCNTALGRTVVDARAQDPKASLEKLQKKITDVLNRWWIKEGADAKVKTDLKLSRMFGPTEAKLTYASQVAGDSGERVILTFMIRYYDGLWTTTDLRTNHSSISGAELMLLFDRAAAE